jgi:co-chaperonin GroES (HSP10)
MEAFEVIGFKTGLDSSGVNFLDPKDAFEELRNGYVYRQELKSRRGFTRFSDGRLAGNTRVMGIFENILPDSNRQLLVADKNFLYSYDSGTDSFNQIAGGGTLAGGYNFNITNDEDYISGTTYLTKDGQQRFVLTGKGMSKVYFYDGTNVLDFTSVVDNPDYQAPALGALVNATAVIWFGERLNLFAPKIVATTYNQGILYSGIRDTAGNGDKFNTSGSGLLEADTYELMKGALILGDIIVMEFNRSVWSLEKTRDAFNPYFVKKIPSVLGTDAGFSAVSWDYEVKSVGKTGLITTDGRKAVRFDDKVPFFGSDEVDQTLFPLTSGGFDRANSQFLFSYRGKTSNLTDQTQDRVLAYNYEESSFSINNQRFSVFGQTDVGANLIWSQIDETQDISWKRWDTTEEIWNKIGIGDSVQKTLAGDNDGFIYELNADFDDYFVSISGITQASSAVITVDESAFKAGDRVLIKNVAGMTEINNTKATVTVASATSITVNIDSTLFTAYTAGGTVSKLIDFRAKMAPFNPFRAQGQRCYVSHIDVLLNSAGGPIIVDLSVDGEAAPYKKDVLLQTTAGLKKREYITCIVDQEADFHNFLFRNESATTQTIISSIRIFTEPGATISR